MSPKTISPEVCASHLYVGLDVSLKETSICIIDGDERIIWRGQARSTPDAIATALAKHGPNAYRIGLESGQLSTWLFHELTALGLPVICIDARYAKAALSMKLNKTDANDALGLAQIMRVGWYREVSVKSMDCHAIKAVLTVRAQLVSQVTTFKNSIRGVLKTFGIVLARGLRSQFPARVREAVASYPALCQVLEPILRALEATRAQLIVYDRMIRQIASTNDTARQLMSTPGVGVVVALAYICGVEDPARFKRSSSVGAYFGMTPTRYQSGEVNRTGRISRRGDGMVRGYLFEAAKVLLGRASRPSALKAWGEQLRARMGSKKATMAVARKLSLILHRMWVTGRPFDFGAATAAIATN